MPGKHTRAAIKELEDAGWQVAYTNGRAHAYAKASCPGGPGCCTPPFSINGTPDMDEHEAQKIRRRMRQHDTKVTARQQEEGR
jgi:hypothetical protein